MKKGYKILVVGIIIGSIGLTTIFASGRIKSAFFTESKVYLRNTEISLSNPLALITVEGSDDAKAYAPVREIANSLGYNVEWKEDDGSIHLYPKSSSEELSTIDIQNHPMPLIGAVHDEDVYLYSLKPEGAVLTYKNISKAFDWICYSPRFIMPQIGVCDYDKDGQKEIAVSLNYGSGTGIDLDDLHVVKVIDDDLIDYHFIREDYESKLENMISHSIYYKNERIYINLKYGNNSIDIDLTAIYPEVTDANEYSFRIDTGITRFHPADDGTIKMNVALRLNTQRALAPYMFANISADVLFSDNEFKITNMEIISPPSVFSSLQ